MITRSAALLSAAIVILASLIAVSTIPAPASSAGSGPSRVLLDKDGAYAREAPALARAGMRVLGDYGSYVLAEIPADLKGAPLASSGVRIRREIGETVTLKRRRVAGARSAPGLPRLRGPGRDDLHVLRLAGPPRAEWVEALRALPGARVLMALPEEAYLL